MRGSEVAPSGLVSAMRIAAAGVLASGLLLLHPAPSEADVQTVSPQMVTQMARPLPKQTVDKGKVWAVLVGGAAVLFGVTVVLENNERFFPAITRANQAMKEATKQMQEAEERAKKEAELLALRQRQYDAQQREAAAVAQGLQEARSKVLGPTSKPSNSGSGSGSSNGASSSGSSSGSGQAPAPAAPVLAAVATSAAAVAAPPSHSAGSEVAPAALHSTPSASSTADSTTGAGAKPTTATDAGDSATAASTAYVVVEESAPDSGAVAWPSTSAPAAAAAAGTASPDSDVGGAAANGGVANGGAASGGGAGPAAEEADAESLARLSRLQGFVSGNMAGGVGALEALRSKQRSQSE